MSKKLLASALLFALASPAVAGNVVVNGGFESGALSPWYNANDYSSGGTPWAVVSGGAQSGLYSAGNIGNIEIRQDFAGVAASSVTAASFWLRHPFEGTAPAYVSFFYSDSSNTGFVVDSTTSEWQQFDILSQLDTSKTLTGFSIYGYNGGSSSDATFLDNVVTNVGGAVPEPASWTMLIAGFGLTGAALRRRRTTVAA